MLTAPPRNAQQVSAERDSMKAHLERVRNLGKPGHASPAPSASLGGLNPKILAAVAAGVVVVLFLGEGEKSKPLSKGKKAGVDATRDLASYLPPAQGAGATGKTAEMFFKSGFREYREKNYIRAKSQFELVLQIAPDHQLAKMYIDNCNKAIDDEVAFHLDRGKKSLSAGRLKEAKGHYESVTRLLFFDQSNPAFAEARDQLESVRKSMQEGGG
jgi:hypothetical protein